MKPRKKKLEMQILQSSRTENKRNPERKSTKQWRKNGEFSNFV